MDPLHWLALPLNNIDKVPFIACSTWGLVLGLVFKGARRAMLVERRNGSTQVESIARPGPLLPPEPLAAPLEGSRQVLARVPSLHRSGHRSIAAFACAASCTFFGQRRKQNLNVSWSSELTYLGGSAEGKTGSSSSPERRLVASPFLHYVCRGYQMLTRVKISSKLSTKTSSACGWD